MDIIEIIKLKRKIDIKKIYICDEYYVRKTDGFQVMFYILFYPLIWLTEKLIGYYNKTENMRQKLDDDKKEEDKENRDKFFKMKKEYECLPRNKICWNCNKAQIDSFLTEFKDSKENRMYYRCICCDIWELS